MLAKRLVLTAVLAAGMGQGAGDRVAAETYPSRPITIVVGFLPGGGGDVIPRAIAHRLGIALKQSVVVENRPGANAAIAAAYVARSAPDGYTLLAGGLVTHVANPNLLKHIAYDPANDFAPITVTGSFVYMLAVHPEVPAKSVAELIAHAKANPGRLLYATRNPIGMMAGATFMRWAGIDVGHVPYKSAPPAVNDLLAGRVSMMFVDVMTALPHVNANTLRGLVVIDSTRTALMPNLPSLPEVGLTEFDGPSWTGFYAPARTPSEIIARLNAEVRRIVDDPDFKARYAALGFEAFSSTPQEMDDLAKKQVVKWAKMVKDAGIEPQ